MAVTVEFGIPVDNLAFHEVFEAHPGAVLEYEHAVSGAAPSRGRLLWVSGIERSSLVEALESAAVVESATPILERDGSILCEIIVDVDGKPLWQAITDNSAYLLGARGSADGWRFEVLFPDRSDISPFIDACDTLDLDIETRHVDTSPFPQEDTAPSQFQADALQIALENGYWDVPRQTSLQTIADELGISDQAASERLRRGIRTLVSERMENGGPEQRGHRGPAGSR